VGFLEVESTASARKEGVKKAVEAGEGWEVYEMYTGAEAGIRDRNRPS
jgi:hypothetical protein